MPACRLPDHLYRCVVHSVAHVVLSLSLASPAGTGESVSRWNSRTGVRLSAVKRLSQGSPLKCGNLETCGRCLRSAVGSQPVMTEWVIRGLLRAATYLPQCGPNRSESEVRGGLFNFTFNVTLLVTLYLSLYKVMSRRFTMLNIHCLEFTARS